MVGAQQTLSSQVPLHPGLGPRFVGSDVPRSRRSFLDRRWVVATSYARVLSFYLVGANGDQTGPEGAPWTLVFSGGHHIIIGKNNRQQRLSSFLFYFAHSWSLLQCALGSNPLAPALTTSQTRVHGPLPNHAQPSVALRPAIEPAFFAANAS